MNFSDIRNHLYDKAEKFWWVSLLIGLFVQITAGFTIFIKNNILIIFSEIILLCLPILARWFQEISKDNTLKAMKCRLSILYSDSFGKVIPSDISKEIKSWVGLEKINVAPFEKPYYDSKLPSGPNRLADITSESAFWTFNLANNMRILMAIYVFLYVSISIFFLYFLLQSKIEGSILMNISKTIIILISVIFTSETILLIKQYNELYSESKKYFHILDKMSNETDIKVTEIMQTVEGYNLLLISSPPLPSFLYKIKQANLNKAYKELIDNG